MYLFNPEDGATIKKLWIYDKKYFETQEFHPGMVIQIDDRPGEHLKKLYGFLEEVTEGRAKKIVEDMKRGKFKCAHPGCMYSTYYQIALTQHMKGHAKPSEIDGVVLIPGLEKDEKEKEMTSTEKIELETKREGLEGPGLVEER